MEIIRKRINLEPYRSRHGSLIPYVLIGEDINQPKMQLDGINIDTSRFPQSGNWGMFPYDIDIRKCQRFISFNGQSVDPSTLRKFFTDDRVPFSVLSDMYKEIGELAKKIVYYQGILKNGKLVWAKHYPTLFEILSINVAHTLPEVPKRGSKIGITDDLRYENDEFANLYLFLLKAMGIFVIKDIYINDKNGVPETLYYTGIANYLQTMERFKDSEVCCKEREYEFLGGDLFYFHLKIREREVEDEILYWFRAIYRDTSYELSSPFMYLPVALNCEDNIIGMYTLLPDTEEESNDFNGRIVETVSQSHLKSLRRSKVSYCTEHVDGEEIFVEMPVILDEDIIGDNNEVETYKLALPYKIGYVNNLTQGENNTYFGDMIYKMDFIKKYSYTEKETFEWKAFYRVTDEGEVTIEHENGYLDIHDFLRKQGLNEKYATEYNGKESGTQHEEFDVWDNPIKANKERLYEFSQKTTLIDEETNEITTNENGETKTETICVKTFSTTLYDFKGSEGYVNIFYVIGGKLQSRNNVFLYEDINNTNERMYEFKDFVKNPMIISSWSVEQYLFMKNEFSKEENYPENGKIKFKGDFSTDIASYGVETHDETWVFKVNSSTDNLSYGDYVIINPNKNIFYFTPTLIGGEQFTGTRFFEQKTWKQFDYTNQDQYSIKMLHHNHSNEVNILKETDIVTNAKHTEIIDITENETEIPCLFYSNDTENLENNSIIALEENFGKVDTMIENSSDILFDRGYVTSFELHYKLGEINTMEDMENYGNNFFRL